MQKIILFIVIILLCSCSSKTTLSSDTEVLLTYNRSKGQWEFVWTWHLKKDVVKRDTIPIKPIEPDK